MKNKKVFWGIAISGFVIGIMLAYIFKPMTMNDIYDEPNFTGTVLEVWDEAILVAVNEDDDEIKSSDKMVVSLNTKLKDSTRNFKVGNEVKVFYDGTILEIYPASIPTVYAILLIND